MAEELFELGCALPATETLMEQAQKEIAVEGIELVLPVLGAHPLQPVAEIVAVVVEEALALDEVDEHQAVEHHGGIPLAIAA